MFEKYLILKKIPGKYRTQILQVKKKYITGPYSTKTKKQVNEG